MSGTMAHLVGDWSVTGVTQDNLETLSVALQQITASCASKLHIDCRQVRAIDDTGQQILKVWLQCARLRGAEPVLLVPPTLLRNFFKDLGPRCRYTTHDSARQTSAVSNFKRRRAFHDS
jgi:ABC-type transporter Mla MlaB component